MHVLVPIDGSEPSTRALAFGIDLAGRFDGELDVVHVGDPEVEVTEQLLEDAREQCGEAGVDATVDAVPEPTNESRLHYATKVGGRILELAEERGVDHIVMGSHGRSGVDEYVLGSAAKTVLDAQEYQVTVLP
ncbi:universal stress protein [Haloarchaeobius iranensis]|uniref:Nucleotide-binding universal stress protein, UspA family n=1 Tax=Haloarchaeobius iranensis TaxID=996166 RepID=A0A1G9UEA1_9EURY|nr:universal stress protein [Haloarchaeobius iranensis]SDM58271.1 Nucleotide-binding universal stress protein, UspA family [Haloarchaeobius iranensis]